LTDIATGLWNCDAEGARRGGAFRVGLSFDSGVADDGDPKNEAVDVECAMPCLKGVMWLGS
jgi:hypothetical protein